MRGPPPGIGQFLKGQLFETPPVPTDDLTGRTYIVTGANSGLGLECCKHLARLGATHIVMGCRSVDRAQEAQASIEAASASKPAPKISIWPIDLAEYKSVAAFAEHCKALDRIDGVIANAGVLMKEFKLAEGDELTMTVNVLATFLLILLMVPVLRKSAQQNNITPHIVVTGSAVQFFADTCDLVKIPEGQLFATLSDQEKIHDWAQQYYVSKLLVMLCVQEVAKQISESSNKDKSLIVLNNVAPGYCHTPLFRNEQGVGTKIGLKLIARTSEQGSRTLVHGVVAGKSSHGKYLSECKVKPAVPFAGSREGLGVQERLWKEVMHKLDKVQPGIGSYLK